MKKVKNTIPVYDIPSIGGINYITDEVIAEPFAAYLQVHPNLHAAHRHSFYHIVLFTKGKGFHTIDFEHFDVVPGQVYFMSPGQVHSWNFKGEVDGYVINFSENLFHNFLSNNQYLEQFSFFRNVAKESVFDLNGETYNAVKKTIEQIVHEAGQQSHRDAFTLDAIRTNLISLFITVQRDFVKDKTVAIPQQNLLILHNFRKLVNSYYAEKRLPKDYAAMLYITPNHLNALCNDLLGKPAGEVIRERILLEAKRMLVNATVSISEIAFQLNFSDNSHFTKFFKKSTDQTPEEFRKTSIT